MLQLTWLSSLTPHPATLHLQGKWLGFRSAAAGDRFLQARKRSPNRLVFFSQNVGTWEQWELAGSTPAAGGEAGSSGAGSPSPDPDASEWASLALVLRHRRLPQFELAVEAVRVGSVSLAGNGSATARSLLSGEPGSVGSAGSAEDDPTLERRELKRMSGVLVHVSEGILGTWAEAAGAAAACLLLQTLHVACCAVPDPWSQHACLMLLGNVFAWPQEWLHYVDQEKAARLAIEARVAQLAEDAAGLRDWAVMQVGGTICEQHWVRVSLPLSVSGLFLTLPARHHLIALLAVSPYPCCLPCAPHVSPGGECAVGAGCGGAGAPGRHRAQVGQAGGCRGAADGAAALGHGHDPGQERGGRQAPRLHVVEVRLLSVMDTRGARSLGRVAATALSLCRHPCQHSATA